MPSWWNVKRQQGLSGASHRSWARRKRAALRTLYALCVACHVLRSTCRPPLPQPEPYGTCAGVVPYPACLLHARGGPAAVTIGPYYGLTRPCQSIGGDAHAINRTDEAFLRFWFLQHSQFAVAHARDSTHTAHHPISCYWGTK